MESLIIFGASLIATIMSSMTGGGSSIISFPIFLSLGIPFPMAVSMQKTNAVFWVLPSAYNYLRGEKVDWSFLIITGGIALVGSVLGVFVVVSLNPGILTRVIGAFILFVLVYMFFKKDMGIQESRRGSRFANALAYACSFPIGVYEGILGAGNGAFFSALAIKARGFSFSKALGHYYAIAFPACLLASVSLIAQGYFEWSLMVPSVLGSVAGGYAGSKFAKQKGNKFIRSAFLIVGTILGLKLVLGL